MTEAFDFFHWLDEQGLGKYADVFRENDVDFRALAHLSDEDLKGIGVSLGHRRILLNAATPPEGHSATPAHDPVRGQVAERRQLTVVFCDVVGSTGLSRRMDPEDWRDLLHQYQEIIAAAVGRYNGYVAQFHGDGVLAYFGWPTAYEDQAERAVRAALDAVKAVQAQGGDNNDIIQVRIGIETGEVVVGDIATDATSDAESATGETPNRAARLQSVGDPNQVVIGLNTRHLVGSAFSLTEVTDAKLKGFSDEEPAWVVHGESGAEGRFDAARLGPLNDLVGRDHELRLLRDRWQLAVDGEGQVVSVSGEAGIGKSRLIQDLRESARNDNCRDLFFQCSPHYTNSAFYPVIQQINRAAGFDRDDSGDVRLDKLEALLGSVTSGELPSAVPLFASLLSLPAAERYGDFELTPQQLRHQIIEAMISQMRLVSNQRPVLVVIEDAHWIDPSMGDFVTQLIPRVAGARIMVVISFRPDNAPNWADSADITALLLNRLGRHQATSIARNCGGSSLPGATIRDIVLRAEGVPLFVEELTKSVCEGMDTSTGQGGVGRVPVTLQSSLVARLDRLGNAKEIAQIGAVIGREFSFELVSAIAGRPDSEVGDALDRLVLAGMVHSRGAHKQAIYTFKHALVQDAAYGTTLISRRRELHGQLVGLLEARADTSGQELVDLLGYHAHQAQIWDKAFYFLSRAGQAAMDGAAIREAVGQYERALDAASHLPATRELHERVIDLRFDLRNALWSIGEFEQILDHLRDAEQLARDLDDSRRLGWISVFRSASYWQLGLPTETLAAADDAVMISRSVQDLPLGVGANFYLGCAHVTAGNLPEAERMYNKIIETVDGDLSHDRCGLPFVPSVVARSWLVWSLAERGEFSAGQAAADVALRIAREVGNPFNLAHIYYDLGYFYSVQGEHAKALDAQQKAMDLITEWKLTYLSPFIGGFLGHAYALAGRVDQALTHLDRAMHAYHAIGLGLFRSLVTVYRGHALMLAGNYRLARQVTQTGLDLAVRRGEKGHQVYALHLMGELELRDGQDPFVAAKHFRDCLQLANSLGMRPVMAHCHIGLAQADDLTGDVESAATNRRAASDLFISLDMQFWAQQSSRTDMGCD